MLRHERSAQGARGFTLVELMVTITVAAILMLAAAPSLSLWIFNTRVRSSAEALQNGLRLAQAEAVRQSRTVVFGLTADTPSTASTLAANSRNWTVYTLPRVGGAEAAEFIRGGPAGDVTGGVVLTNSPAAVCFSSLGNLITVGTLCTAAAQSYDFSHPRGDRSLRVELALNGRVRMCDPLRAIATAPDGCN